MKERIKRYSKLLSSQKGMTLIEIMVVIAIIGMVTGAIGFGVTRYLSDAKVDAAKIQLDKIGTILETKFAKDGEYPSSLDELTKKGKGGSKAYLEESSLKDPWKTKFIYSPSEDGFKLCSAGPDKREGTDDDQCHGEADKGE